MYVSQNIMLYILNVYSELDQLYLSQTEGKNYGI